jgi:hypothetical protein
MKLIRKTKSSLIPYGILIAISVTSGFRLYNENGEPFVIFVVLLLSLVAFLIVIRSAIMPYITVDNQRVCIKSGFRTKMFFVSDIEKVVIASSSFKPSKFILKDSKEILFESNSLREDDILFLQSLNKSPL